MSVLPDSTSSSNISMRNSSTQNQVADVSEGVYPRGYPELAAFMRSDPEISIFRRFDYLHLRELLHLQEELTLLEEKLHEVDRAEPKEINNMSRRHDTNEERRNLMFQIRARLLEYGAVAPLSLRYYPCFPMGLIFSKKDQLLINYERIVNFNVPMKRNIRHFRRWLDNMNPVIAEESTVYHNERDLCTTNTYVSDYSLLETIFHWLAGRVIGIRGFSWVTHTTSYDRGLVVCADNCDVLDFPDRIGKPMGQQSSSICI